MIKKKKRAIFSAFLMLATALIFFPTSASALNISNAVTYAQRHYSNYNTVAYKEIANADCANFVSQILRAGGISEDYNTSSPDPALTSDYIAENNANYWYHKRSVRSPGVSPFWKYSHTFTFVTAFRGYVTSHSLGYYSMYSDPTNQRSTIIANTQVGEVIQMTSTNSSTDHSGFCTNEWSDVPRITAHTNDRVDYDINNYVDYAISCGKTFYIISIY
jgi:hypothetical protein